MQKGKNKRDVAESRKLTGKFTPRMVSLKDARGGVLGNKNEVKMRWKDYKEELYDVDMRIIFMEGRI